MTASTVEGTVTVQGSDGSVRTLAQGTQLYEWDVLQTSADSRLEISMTDGSTLRLGENTRLELRVAPPTGKAFAARLWLGAVWAKVHKLLQDESFHIETQNAVAGVRGTEFLVEAGAGSRDDNVRVYEGAVEVRGHGGEWMHRVEPGHELSVRHGQTPTGPKPFDPASEGQHPLMRWVREKPVHAPDSPDRPDHRAPEGGKKNRERPEKRHRFLERLRGR
jgi:ferric-dicitrate binding protein FerR (iron transport regulator)